MRPGIARALALLAVPTILATSALAAPVAPERRIVPGRSLGPVELGMTRDAAAAAVQRAAIAGPPTEQDLGEAVQVSFELDPARFPRGEDRQPQLLTLRFMRGTDRVLSVGVEARGRPGMVTDQNVGGGSSLLVAARLYRPSVIKVELAYGGRLHTEFRDLGIGFVSRSGSQAILSVYVFAPASTQP